MENRRENRRKFQDWVQDVQPLSNSSGKADLGLRREINVQQTEEYTDCSEQQMKTDA